MKRINSIFIVCLIFFCKQVIGQDYTPTKETVGIKNRYKAKLILSNPLKECDFQFFYKSMGFNRLKLNSWVIKDSLIELHFFQGYHTDSLPVYKIYYLNLEISPVEYNKKKDYYSTSFNTTQGRIYLLACSYEATRQVVDAFFVLKNLNQTSEDQKELENFKSIAQNYKQLIIKPDLNEDARRFLVQATTATEEKSYNDAIELLEKAIAIDPAYPQAHFNLALLWAQVSIYGAAILEMKKYLMLVPDAADARASQDKIYEWERKLNK